MAARVSVRVAEDALTRDLPRVLGDYAEAIARRPELAQLLEQRASLFAVRADIRREMLRVSAGTMFLGLTEPLFVPEYWNPPTLGDLARRTGFDLESLLFSFAIGGIVFAISSAAPPRRAWRTSGAIRGTGITCWRSSPLLWPS